MRQSYLRVAKRAAIMAGRYAHAKHFKGHEGDAADAILTAAGYNFRRVLAWLKRLLLPILYALLEARPAQAAFNPAS